MTITRGDRKKTPHVVPTPAHPERRRLLIEKAIDPDAPQPFASVEAYLDELEPLRPVTELEANAIGQSIQRLRRRINQRTLCM